MTWLAELEGIIHSRLPPEKAPAILNQSTETEEMVEEDVVDKEVDEIDVEETVTDHDVANRRSPDFQVSVTETAPIKTETNASRPSLPAFVTDAATMRDTPPKAILGANPSAQKVPEPVPITAIRVVESTENVYSMGAWKGVQTNLEEEENEIPEIDMGFDSDEE